MSRSRARSPPPRSTWVVAEALLADRESLLYWAGNGLDPADLALVWCLDPSFHPFSLADSGPLVIMTRQ